jgi:hypothetical protein
MRNNGSEQRKRLEELRKRQEKAAKLKPKKKSRIWSILGQRGSNMRDKKITDVVRIAQKEGPNRELAVRIVKIYDAMIEIEGIPRDYHQALTNITNKIREAGKEREVKLTELEKRILKRLEAIER